MRPQIAVTLDVDWAPDFAIDAVAELLVAHEVKATWFVTHASAAIDRLRRYPSLFELGIHPNFLPNSTQGRTSSEVLAFCTQLVPDAISMRTHALVQSTPLLAQILSETSIERDASLFLPYHRHLRPTSFCIGGGSLLRIPYFWEDDYEMAMAQPDWNIPQLVTPDDELAIFDFHPIHVALNSASMSPYRQLTASTASFSSATQADAAPYVQNGAGSGTAFRSLLEFVASGAARSVTVREIDSPPAGPQSHVLAGARAHA